MKRNALIPLALIMMAGCNTDMWVQPKLAPLDKSEFHNNNASARAFEEGTIARGKLREDDAFFKGIVDGKPVTKFPLPVTKELLERGQERFRIYCTPCHGQLGDGQGMIAKRGLVLKRPPATYHTDRLRNAPVGHFYDVITNGYGVMFPYASRVEPKDRWAIVAYIRVLQRSQNAKMSDLTTENKEDIIGTEKEGAK
ncbi:MAG: cytochrome c [Armatimonadetes bacterium]|nr:cytochrome c [Armatimonadota bacterium]